MKRKLINDVSTVAKTKEAFGSNALEEHNFQGWMLGEC